MSAEQTKTTRRAALKRGLLVAGGALGLGAAGKAALDRDDVTAAAAKPGEALRLTLTARNLRSSSPDREPGRLSKSGDRVLAQAELFDGDERAGDFVATAFAVDALGGSSLELHTLALADGSLQGMGSGGSNGGSFAVVGGTGRFAGARGAYELVRNVDGSAALTIDLRL